jgi:uncharacterized protein
MVKSLEDRLIIHLAKIPDEGLEIRESLPPEWLTNIPEFMGDGETHIEGMIEARGFLTREADNLRLTGGIEAELATVCSRCGKPVKHPLTGEFEVVLMKGPAAEEAGAEDKEEDNLRYYEGLEVDLNPFFREEVALQAPIQTLCKKDCAGLCARCGADLNEEKCACPHDDGDAKLAALRNLKIN